MKVLILGDFSASVIKKIEGFSEVVVDMQTLKERHAGTELRSLLLEHQPDVLVVEVTHVTEELLKDTPFIKMVVCTRGNPVNVDSKYCAEHGIILTNTPGRNANAVAEFVLGLMINLVRRIPEAIARVKSGELVVSADFEESIRLGKSQKDVTWRHDQLPVIPYFELCGGELFGKCLGLVGFGAVGKLTAKKACALDMKVIAYDPYYSGPAPGDVQFCSLDELAANADIISLHAKDTPETEGMIGEDFLGKVKDGAYIINTARGRLINRAALLKALDSGKLAGAALDVFDYEPLCKEDPFLHNPKIICTPHIGGASRDVVIQHSLRAFESISAYAKGAAEIPFRHA
jgi:D-3-phosphoglycerate dehydrogenase